MSIKTHKINKNPRFTKHLVKKGVFISSPLVVVDVGARGGFEDQWKWFSENQIRLIGFEPNKKECAKLNNNYAKNREKYYPIALAAKKEKRPFYLYSHRPSSSFYKENAHWQRFPDFRSTKIEGTYFVPVTDIDSFAKESGIGAVDFMKIDTQGAEHEVLSGGKKTLSCALGVSLEVWFNINKNQKRFGDLDRMLSSLGFTLFDLVTFRSAKTALSPYIGARVPGPTDFGQTTFGQALYLRDGVEEISQGKKLVFNRDRGNMWDERRICKLASIMELFSLPDCAIELLMVAREKKVIRKAPHMWYDLLTPTLNGRRVSYDGYMNYFKNNPPQRYPHTGG